MWLVQVECVLSALVLVPLKAVNCHFQLLQLVPLEVRYHRELVLFLGSMAFIPVLVLPMTVLFISMGKLWIMFLSVAETLVIVASGWSGWIFLRSSKSLKIVMNLIVVWGWQGLGSKNCDKYCDAQVYISKWHIWHYKVWWKVHCVMHLFLPCFFY